jgi:hypothetical protein
LIDVQITCAGRTDENGELAIELADRHTARAIPTASIKKDF